MVRTRVGYAGGTKDNPTYYNLGDHAETVQLEYDPAKVSYNELLDVFWRSHAPDIEPFSRQYASIIFYHDEEQKRLAEESKAREEAKLKGKVYTEILPYTNFYLAEYYHQKYYLQQIDELMREYRAIYPSWEDFVNSTAVARVNGYIGGGGTCEALKAELDSFGLSPTGKQRLVDEVCPSGQRDIGSVCPVPEK